VKKITSFEELYERFQFDDIRNEVLSEMSSDELMELACGSDDRMLLQVLDDADSWRSPEVKPCFDRLCYLYDVDADAYEYYDDLYDELTLLVENNKDGRSDE